MKTKTTKTAKTPSVRKCCAAIEEAVMTRFPDSVNSMESEIGRGSVQLWFMMDEPGDDSVTDTIAGICDDEFGRCGFEYVDWDATNTCFTIWYEKTR